MNQLKEITNYWWHCYLRVNISIDKNIIYFFKLDLTP